MIFLHKIKKIKKKLWSEAFTPHHNIFLFKIFLMRVHHKNTIHKFYGLDYLHKNREGRFQKNFLKNIFF